MYRLADTGIESYIRNATPESDLLLTFFIWSIWTIIVILITYIITYIIVKHRLKNHFYLNTCRKCKYSILAPKYYNSREKYNDLKNSVIDIGYKLFDYEYDISDNIERVLYDIENKLLEGGKINEKSISDK